ncbi:MAG TPA: TrmB family transcriptional regulator sugar-binding domain-containing protein [Thermoplasmata archaeon]|nr:TrmB family transcriptional regulator sugar-binding domain-containing protein [Thermoplasmata archaeon]
MSRSGSGLFDLLTEHGVPAKGARLYLAACRSGAQTASELARLSAVNRVEAYRIIKQLAADGLLTATGSRPQRFAALSPDALVDKWIHRASDRLHRLEQDREKVLAEWEEGRTEVDERDPRRFAVLEGRETIRRFLRKRIGTAERQILVSANGPWLSGLIDGGIDRSLKDASARGVKVRVVTEVYLPNLPEAKHLSGFSELRHANGPIGNRAVVVDRTGALVYVSGEEGLGRTGEEQVALWSSSPSFVQLARDYHRRLWAPANRAESRFVELESPPTATLPVVAGRESVPFQRLKEVAKLGMRASGVREFRLHLPELIDVIALQLGREIAKEVEGRTPEEVARSLGRYYATHTMGQLGIVKERPLTLQVTGCFACTQDSPEIGRVMCPQLLKAVLETRLGQQWVVSKPDPTKHAARGCVFTATVA